MGCDDFEPVYALLILAFALVGTLVPIAYREVRKVLRVAGRSG